MYLIWYPILAYKQRMSTAGTKKKKMLLSSRSGDGAINAQKADSSDMLPESERKQNNLEFIVEV